MAIGNKLAYDEWEKLVPLRMHKNPLRELVYYRLAMRLYDLVWQDCVALKQDFRGRTIVDHSIRSSGNICTNMEETYGRGRGPADYIRIMRIALGEARETQSWYLRSRHKLSPKLLEQRLDVVD